MPTLFRADRWKVLLFSPKNPDIENFEPIYKVMCGNYGGYLHGNSWQMNSGIKSYKEEDGIVYFYGYSGSEYQCRLGAEGFNSESGMVTNNYVEQSKNHKTISVTIIDYTDFVKQFKNPE